jgi:hypothetical protein
MQPVVINNHNQSEELKETYIEDIIVLLNDCDDISLIDLIKRLLEKSI